MENNTSIQRSDLNPFSKTEQKKALIDVESNRAMQEVQAALVIAKKFPRDKRSAMSDILDSCTRPTLADQAIYVYPRGGTKIEGPSIRLAEAIAQQWSNLQYGIIELEQNNGVSICQAYAWDLETNTRKNINFHVEHSRYSKAKGKTPLVDPRDIYEMVSNQGSRRVRNCILAIIPGDVVEAAEKQCKVTQQNLHEATPETIQKMITAFSKLDVSEDMLNKRIGHKIQGINSAQIINLKRVYTSIKDRIGKISDFFESDEKVDKSLVEQAKDKLNKANQAENNEGVKQLSDNNTIKNSDGTHVDMSTGELINSVDEKKTSSSKPKKDKQTTETKTTETKTTETKTKDKNSSGEFF